MVKSEAWVAAVVDFVAFAEKNNLDVYVKAKPITLAFLTVAEKYATPEQALAILSPLLAAQKEPAHG